MEDIDPTIPSDPRTRWLFLPLLLKSLDMPDSGLDQVFPLVAVAKSIQFLPALDLANIFFSAVANLGRSYVRAGKRLCSRRSDGDVYFSPDPNSRWCRSSPSGQRNWLCQSHIRMSLRVLHGKSRRHFIKNFSTFFKAKSIIGYSWAKSTPKITHSIRLLSLCPL